VKSADHVFRWPGVTLAPGENHLAVRAQFGAETITDAATWTYRPPEKGVLTNP
jgi:hypothetical protein